MEGVIKNLHENRFGFIAVDGKPKDAKDLFFHENDLQGVSFDDLRVGDKVSFEEAVSKKGPNAVNVTRI